MLPQDSLAGLLPWPAERPVFIRVSLDSNRLRRHFRPAGAPCARRSFLLNHYVLFCGLGHLPRRALPDCNLVTIGQVDRRIEDDLVTVLDAGANLDGRAEV